MVNIRKVSALLAALLLLVGLGAIAWAYEAWCSDRIYPGVQVWGVAVGGLRMGEAARALEARLLALSQPTFILRGPDRIWRVRPTDLGLRLATEATVRTAFRVGRGAGDGMLDHLWLLAAGQNLPPVLSYDEPAARLYLETLAREMDFPPTDATLTLEGITPVASPARPGQALDVEASLAALRGVLESLGTGGVGLVVRDIPPQVTDAQAARAQAEAILSQPLVLLLANPQEGDPGPWSLPPEELAPMITTLVNPGHLQVTLDREQLRGYLVALAEPLAIEPVDARFHFDPATGQLAVMAPSAEGRALDVEASIANILSAVEAGEHVAPLALQTVPPRYAESSTAQELGIRELVAEGDSYFIGSPSGRDHNIRLAASKFDGLVIAPGETFSFNGHLGEVSAEAGYDEAYVTAGEQLAIEVGGGICQVSTTVFRAALWGGYPIIERWFHHHRVGYYELRGYGPGFDATVYSPLVDFRFVNDRPTALLIDTEVEEAAHRLIFRFYSTDDGRRVEVEGPVITDETEPGPPIYQLDETLAPGRLVEWQTVQNGLTATVRRRVYDAAGNLLLNDTFVSRYAPRRAAFHYGPGYQPPQEATGP